MIDEEDMCVKEKKTNERTKFFNEIKKCKDFSYETQDLITMASGTGGKILVQKDFGYKKFDSNDFGSNKILSQKCFGFEIFG